MDTSLKQRLVGAVVLVALAVIFLPMLIKGPAPDSGVSDVPLDVPHAPDGGYETRELPLVTPGSTPPSGAVGMPDGPERPAGTATPATDAAMQPAATAAGNYAVSFGAYATAADADAVISGLTRAQLPGYREAATVNGRDAFRVRVGPYPDRASAESARLQAVKVRNDVNAQVVVLDASASTAAATPAGSIPTTTAPSVAQPATATATVTTEALPPEPSKPAVAKPEPAKPTTPAPTPTTSAPRPTTAPPAAAEPATPAASSVGFAVQLGAFSSATDANALRDKVRAGGFSAFVEQVRTDKGTLNRVRVGPVASRADADALRAQVASRFGIDGMVRPHP